MTPARAGGTAAMARAVRRGEWERLSLYLLLAFAAAADRAPAGTIDDLLALLADEEAHHGRREA